MAILNIVKETDENSPLRKKSRKVEEITPRIITLLDDMKDTLLKADGVGLAAPQVGVLKRIALVIDTSDNDRIYELINPEIIASSGEQQEIEGCLSLPEKWAYTNRPMEVTVRATDRNGSTFTVSGTGLTARCFCHEIDHLDGTLFTDNSPHILSKEEVDALFSAE